MSTMRLLEARAARLEDAPIRRSATVNQPCWSTDCPRIVPARLEKWLLRLDSEPLAPSDARRGASRWTAWRDETERSEGMAPQAGLEPATLRLTALLGSPCGLR